MDNKNVEDRMEEISIQMVPHSQQRYDTCGDYWTDDFGVIHIRVSAMGDWRYEFLVALHEMVEKAHTRHLGISEASIDAFDMAYEAARAVDDISSEPGDVPSAPYHMSHRLATAIELVMAKFLDVDWDAYDKKVREL